MNRFPSWIHRIPEMIETLALAVPNASIGKRRSACLICVPLLTRHSINAGLNARQSSTGIQPRDTGARRCQSESFHTRPFPLGRRRCSERPGAVKGAPIGAAKRTLDGEDRSEIIRRRGKGQRTGSVLSADKQKRCQGGNHDSI